MQSEKILLAAAGAGGDKKYVYLADYSASSIYTVDVTDPSDPSIVNTLTDTTDLFRPEYMVADLAKGVLFTSVRNRKFASIDISDPKNTSIADTVTYASGDTHEGKMGIDPDEERVFYARGGANAINIIGYSDIDNLSAEGEFSSSANADNTRSTAYQSRSYGSGSADYVYYAEVDDSTIAAIDVDDSGSISFVRARSDSLFIGVTEDLFFDTTNEWLWHSKSNRLTAVFANTAGNSLANGTWAYTTNDYRTCVASMTSIQDFAVDEARQHVFVGGYGTNNIQSFDFSSGSSVSSSDDLTTTDFVYGLAVDSENQILYASTTTKFLIYDISDISNITLTGSITSGISGGRHCVLGYDPTA